MSNKVLKTCKELFIVPKIRCAPLKLKDKILFIFLYAVASHYIEILLLILLDFFFFFKVANTKEKR